MNRLEQKKKELEIQLLESQIKPKSKVDDTIEKLRKWVGLLLIMLSVPGTIWGIYLPIRSYWQAKEKEVKYSLSSPMVDLVTQLKSNKEGERDEALVMLAYYEMNSYDILHFILENHQGDSPELIEGIADVLNRIYKRGHSSVFDNLNSSLTLIVKNKLNGEDQVRNNKDILYRYAIVIKRLELNKKHSDKRRIVFNNLKSQVNGYEFMQSLIRYLENEEL